MTTLISTNPAKGYDPVGEVTVSTEQEIIEKVSAANEAKGMWCNTPIQKRIELVAEIHEILKDQKEEIAQLIVQEVGKTVTNAHNELDYYLEHVKWCLANVERAITPNVQDEGDDYVCQVEYEPWGSVAVISPWNFPFGMAMWGIVPNLLVGNTVVFKTSEECPLVGKLLEDVFDKANLPDGVLSVVHGDGAVGDILTDQNVDMIWFTGSTKTGKHLYKKAGEKFIPALLEMGGSSPAVVFEDVDVDQGVDTVFNARFYHCGQVCTAVKRAIVHESIYDDFVTKLKTKLDQMTIGNPEDENTDLGPLTAERQKDLAAQQISDAENKGASIYRGPSVDGMNGAYVQPVLVTDVKFDMRVWTEETFAPILPIVSFTTEEEAVKLANYTEYGLNAIVLTKDSERGLRVARQIDAGGLKVGEKAPFSREMPFGGYKSSGMGREHGVIGMRQLCQVKGVSLSKN